MAFEGATKRNKPNIAIGALVYARVVVANKHMEAELSCTSPHFKKEWVTRQSLFGELEQGYAFRVSLRLARTYVLYNSHCLIINLLNNVSISISTGSWMRTVQCYVA
jgi:exosome complex component RRP40